MRGFICALIGHSEMVEEPTEWDKYEHVLCRRCGRFLRVGRLVHGPGSTRSQKIDEEMREQAELAGAAYMRSRPQGGHTHHIETSPADDHGHVTRYCTICGWHD